MPRASGASIIVYAWSDQEPTKTDAPKPEPEAAGMSGGRRAAVWSLLVLATVIGIVVVMTTWINRQMLSNDSFRTASRQLIQDPEIRNTLSVYLVDQLYENVDVEQALQKRLPDDLQGLAGPLSTALRQPLTNAADRLLSRPRVQKLWIDASGLAHQQVVNVLEDKTGAGISTGNGEVTLNLRPIVAELGKSLGLPAAALAALPPKAGVFTIMRSDQLKAAQTGVQVLRALTIWLFILVLALYALAIYLARGARRETLRNTGWAFVLIGLIALVVRRVAGSYTIGALVDPGYRVSAHHVWLISTSILGSIGRATIIYGLIIVLGAVLAGPTRAGTAVRRWLAPVLNTRPGVTWGSVGGVFLLIVLWGPTHALRAWWGVVLFGALIALGVAALRHETLREFSGRRRSPSRRCRRRRSGRPRTALELRARPRRPRGEASGYAAGNGDPRRRRRGQLPGP